MNVLILAGRTLRVGLRSCIFPGEAGCSSRRKVFSDALHFLGCVRQFDKMRVGLYGSSNQQQFLARTTPVWRTQEQINGTGVLDVHVVNPVMIAAERRNQGFEIDVVDSA